MSEVEKAAFETLFLDTRAQLLGYLNNRVPSEDAVDLLAEVYLIAWRKRSALPRGDERCLWLFGVARRLVAEHHRSTPGRADAARAWSEIPARTWEPLDDRRGEAVRTALASLNSMDRELITLTTWDRLSSADAARVVGITAGTARVRLHRARARLARDPHLRAAFDHREGEAHEVPPQAPGEGCPRPEAGPVLSPPDLPRRATLGLQPPPVQAPSPISRSPWAPV